MIGLIILIISSTLIAIPLLYGLCLFLVYRLESIHPLLPYSLLFVFPLVGLILFLCEI